MAHALRIAFGLRLQARLQANDGRRCKLVLRFCVGIPPIENEPREGHYRADGRSRLLVLPKNRNLSAWDIW